MTASWSRPHLGSTEYKRGSRDCSRPMAGSPRIIARPTTRSRAGCRRARVRQGQAFGGAKEAPSLTAAARDGDSNVRSGWKNARGAGRTKEWSNDARQKWGDAPLTKKAPYKPCPQKRMTASWSRPHVGSTEYKRGSRDCSRPMAGSPRIIARPTTRSRAACRRARVRQGQAFGGAKEAPSLTAAARDGDGNVRSGWKNARGAGRTKDKRME